MKDKNVNIEEPIVFENKTDSAFEVSAGVVFHKSGIYEVSVLKNKTIVSKVTERKRGKWIRITQGAMPEQYICPFCHRTIEAYGVEELLSIRYPYCHCGADMRGEEDAKRVIS